MDEMASIWPEQYSYEALTGMAMSGLETVWGPFTVLGIVVSILVILVGSFAVLWKKSQYGAVGAFVLGSLMSLFTWWQVYWTFFDYFLVAILSLVLVVGLGIVGWKGGFVSWALMVAIGITVVFVTYMVLWVEPYYFDWAQYPFYWSPW